VWSGGLAASAETPALPAIGDTSEPSTEEDVGPIGRYVRGDGTDGEVVLTDGDDIFVGGDGDEHVLGGAGDDYIDGAGGDDHLEGQAGDDTLLGGSGNHFLNGGTGIDRLAGGTGNEILVLADVRDSVTELGLGIDQGGNDTVVVADSYAASLRAVLPGTGGRATFVLGRPDIAVFPDNVAGYRQQIDPDIENIRLTAQPGTTWSATTGGASSSAMPARTASMPAAAMTRCRAVPAPTGSTAVPVTIGWTAVWATTPSMAAAATMSSCSGCTNRGT
jgi:hypothetical protein